jgi:hypothetical protein
MIFYSFVQLIPKKVSRVPALANLFALELWQWLFQTFHGGAVSGLKFLNERLY